MPFPALCCLLAAAQEPARALDLRTDYTKTEVMVPMRDGKRLYTAIYAPKDTSQRWPFLMQRTPYSCSPYGADRMPRSLGPNSEFVKKGYIFVMQDVRGRYMSEDDHVFSPPHKPNKRGLDHDESSDCYDTVDYLLKSVPNNNGKVGVWGISQPGFYATNAILSHHPAIVAVSPQAPVTDRFRGDDDHHNGAFFLAQRFSFLNGFGAPRPKPIERMEPTFRASYKDIYRYFLDLGSLPAVSKLFGDKNKFWLQSMAHGTYDDYWKPRGMEQHLKGLSNGPAVLVVGGWFDAEDLYGALKTYNAIATGSPQLTSYLVMGPWTHGQWAGDRGERIGGIEFGSATGPWYNQSVVLPFFEHYLRGAPDPHLAKATVFESGANRWHRFEQWPPKLVADGAQRWRFAPKGRLVPSENAASVSGSDSYVSDPRRPVPFIGEVAPGVPSRFMVGDQRFAWERPDVLSYSVGPFDSDKTLAGPIIANLRTAISTTDADFVVKVIDEFPEDAPANTATTPPTRMASYQMLVRAEIMRGKFRDSLEKPKPFVPGKPTQVRLQLNDVFHTLKKGHRLMVQVQSSWFPLADLNPQKFVDIYHAKPTDFQPATIRMIYGGGKTPGSQIYLPFVKLGDSAITPPTPSGSVFSN